MGNKRLITDFLEYMRFGQLLYIAYSVAVRGLLVAVYSLFSRIGIYIGGRGGRRFRSCNSGIPDIYIKT